MMKGIILAGGFGTRLYPMTKTVCKQCLPVYDKPMIYYPLSVLMLAGIRDILIISSPDVLPIFSGLFGDGKQLGMKISYEEQVHPNGIAEAFLLGETFIGSDNVCLILGDNIFYGDGMSQMLKRNVHTVEKEGGASVFAYYVDDPSGYGIVSFDKTGKVTSIEEKPNNPKSNYAVTGLYFYDNEVIRITKGLRPSERGELEITDVNREYLKKNALRVELFGRGYAWLDAGTPINLLEAGEFIAAIEKRQGLKIGCVEEIAFSNGFISKEQLLKLSDDLKNSEYGVYLKKLSDIKSFELI